MDAHDERTNPRPEGSEPDAPRPADTSAKAGLDPVPSGQDPVPSGQDPVRPGQDPGPASSRGSSGQEEATLSERLESPERPDRRASEHEAEAEVDVDVDVEARDEAEAQSEDGDEDEDEDGDGDRDEDEDGEGHRGGDGRGAGPAHPGISGLSPRYQIVAAVALAAICVTACVHLGLVFLSVAPANTMTKQHGEMVDDWVLPEFEQNWKLFAPNPLQQNIAVEARAEVRSASGETRTTGWYNISALDGAAIDGNPLPSHTQQNELRRAWDFFVSSHDNQNRATGMRGELSEGYLRRIIVLRLQRLDVDRPASGTAGQGGPAGTIKRIQIRSMTTSVQPPGWSGTAPSSDKPLYRTLAWWTVTSADVSLGGVKAGPAPKTTTTEAKAR